MKNNHKHNIIILHGWGLSGNKYKDLKSILEFQGYKVFIPDFPGFGIEPLKEDGYHLIDYAKFLDEYIKNNKLNDIVLIGHSFGGRVIVKYMGEVKDKKIEIKAIIISGSPLIRQKISSRKKIIIGLLKPLKIIYSIFPEKIYKNRISYYIRKLIYRAIGEMDYYKASKNNMKKTFINIINEDQEKNLKKINTPTLLLWGKEDRITPLSIGVNIHKKIAKSRLSIIKNETHKFPYDNPEKFAKETLAFMSLL
ncbi:alpha/beta hydrolase [Candidatus Parcubacteria bacterium]|nr:MAG: alpha/beta hydrolase [Candidatus Parcubacteria bacterium]